MVKGADMAPEEKAAELKADQMEEMWEEWEFSYSMNRPTRTIEDVRS